jgi:circadian clock protein KaiC
MSPTDGEHAEERAVLPRLSTGNPELDHILGGGFPESSINILMGEPGSGKTILAEQMMFANATGDGRPLLFLTTLSEPLDKVVRYLQQFTFFDQDKLAASIVYDTIGQELAEQGVAMLVPRMKDIIKQQRPKLIVIDSFKAIHDLSTSVAEMRRMLYELAGLLSAYDTTVFLVGEYSADDVARYPEFAVADGMLELARNKLGVRDERFLRVLKLRGSSYHEGLHAFRITKDGLEVFPRLVSPNIPPTYGVADERVATGIAGLDHMLGGGLVRGRSTFMLGPTGSGKTTLALQFVLEGVRRGEKCMYVSFEENPSQLDAQIRSLGTDPVEARERGLTFLYVSPVELQIDSILTTIFHTIQQCGIRRLGVDAVGDLLAAANDTQRLHNYLYALQQHFAVGGVTSIFPYETAASGEVDARLSPLADNVLLLGLHLAEGRGRRSIRVIKARGIEHDLDERELCITRQGVEVAIS